MNLQQIRYFVTTAQLESVSKAAEIYHISQSSLSKNIARLEEELGMPLFERNGKRISLNKAGERFLESSIVILRETESAVSDMHLMMSGEDLTIKIGFAGKINALSRCLKEFRAKHPNIQYELKSDIEDLDHIDINAFDVLIYPDEPRYMRFSGYRINEEKYYLAVPAESELARSAVASPGLMQGKDFVFLRRKDDHVEFPCRICTNLAIRMNTRSFVDSRGAHRRMIAMGMAIGFVPEGEVEAYSQDRHIRLLPILDRRFHRQLMICFKREKHLSETARQFRDMLMKELSLT